jgi:hypothetical protein
MTVTPKEATIQASEKLKGQVFVRNVIGGQETNPLWTSQVDSKAFKAALESSLQAYGYKAANPTAMYVVDVDLVDLKQPIMGFSFDVKSTAAYKISSGSVKESITVTATGTATASDAFIGTERLKLANEKSIKENIQEFIKRLTAQFGK